jgi:hypothetical protein
MGHAPLPDVADELGLQRGMIDDLGEKHGCKFTAFANAPLADSSWLLAGLVSTGQQPTANGQ